MMTLINCGADHTHKNKLGDGIYNFMSDQTLKYYNLYSSLNYQIDPKKNDKIFIKQECSICLEKKRTMVFLKSCQHIVMCKNCFNIMQKYRNNRNDEYNDEYNIDKSYKCPFCNIESLNYKIVEFIDND
jgi:hypothetical protein